MICRLKAKQVGVALLLSTLLLAAAGRAASSVTNQQAQQLPASVAENAEQAHFQRDYFFFSCVNAYLRIHNLPAFDSSPGLTLDYLLAFEPVVKLAEEAKRAAATIELSDHAKHEGIAHPAVLAVCLEESRKLPGLPWT